MLLTVTTASFSASVHYKNCILRRLIPNHLILKLVFSSFPPLLDRPNDFPNWVPPVCGFRSQRFFLFGFLTFGQVSLVIVIPSGAIPLLASQHVPGMLKLDCPHGISIASQSCIGSDPNMVMDSSTVGKDGSGVLASLKALALNTSPSFKEWGTGGSKQSIYMPNKMESLDAYRLDLVVPCHVNTGEDCALACAGVQPDIVSPEPSIELQAAASKLQKMYRGYRTRRNLADCAVVIEELWWSEFASLSGNSITFYHVGKSESTFSRWARVSRKAAMVGKGLSKDLKAQKLALRHWLEVIDPRHRYGHNLSMYYNIWLQSESTQPFFYWLDVGDGKELSIDKCPRQVLQHQCIQYLGLKERKAYEVIVKNGKLIYRKNKQLVDTSKGAKWIFVLSTCRTLYVGQKIKGKFQHSSFLAGAATTAAGRIVVKDGILLAIWPYSGHYTPTEENFKSFISYLLENNVDLTNVKRGQDDSDDYYSSEYSSKKYVITPKGSLPPSPFEMQSGNSKDYAVDGISTPKLQIKKNEHHLWDTTAGFHNDYSSNVDTADSATTPKFPAKSSQQHSWTTGAGARIGCVRDYPTDLQFKALEQVLSPRPPATPRNRTPVPSPRPSPALMISPRIAHMGLPSPAMSPRFGYFAVSSPRISLTLPELRKK